MQFNRHEILRRFGGLTHQEQLPVERLVLCHEKQDQLRIVSGVINYLEDRIEKQELWRTSRDKRYSLTEELDAELALGLERKLYNAIRADAITAQKVWSASRMELAA